MCGIIGLYHKDHALGIPAPSDTRRVLEQMQGTLSRRGPDEGGLARLGPAWLAHTRLSIIDLSTGSQPVYNEDGRIAVVLNGEIYNYQELRNTLERAGHRFRTTSDTEVIVHLYEEHGEAFLEQLNGMFAIVLYDSRFDTLIVARDRMGEKPVLYCETRNELIVASEIKALLQHPAIEREFDPEAIALYLSASYVPAPLSIFRMIRKLPPAHYLKASAGNVSVVQYWRPHLSSTSARTEDEMCEEFVALFADAVRMRMVADVPLGVFLSGGIDSSAVTAFMARTNSSVKTFTVGFSDETDERPFARQVADRYRTEHTELFLESKIETFVDEILGYMDEPFGDSSIVPTFVVAREARKHVKVILTGDGGDELFAGYSAYLDQKTRRTGRATSKVARLADSFFRNTPLARLLDASYPARASKYARTSWLAMRTAFNAGDIEQLMEGSGHIPAAFFERRPWLPIADHDPLSAAFEFDMNYYLPDDLLKKVDMASMCASLECRAPFLDHRVVEFAFSIPALAKVRGNSPKYLLKRALEPYLPATVLHREKTGFGAPVPSWVRHRLKGPILESLGPGALIEEFVRRKGVDEILGRCFKQPAHDAAAPYRVWLLFVLERWMRAYGPGANLSRNVA